MMLLNRIKIFKTNIIIQRFVMDVYYKIIRLDLLLLFDVKVREKSEKASALANNALRLYEIVFSLLSSVIS